MADTTYNGWTNCETWLVNLWMDNEPGSHELVREQAREFYGQAYDEPHLTRAQRAFISLADWLKEFHEENRPELPGVYGDLLGGALSSVNWDEIARHYIDAIVEEESNA